jgi:DNA polymerase elongation subunit (family B)
MYQSIYYNWKTRECHLRDDSEGWCQFEYQPTYYRLHPEGKYATLDGKRANPTKKYVKEDKDLYEKDVDKNLSILLDIYRDTDDVPSYHNKIFIDIETERGEAINLNYCQRAPMKVTAIALYDEQGKHYYAYILDENRSMSSSTNDDTSVIPCTSEPDLLLKFLDKWKEIDPTIVIHWNGDSFDIPYLYNRMKKIIGPRKANELSPLNIVEFDERDTLMPYKIAGVSSLDMMRLYKKFIPRQQPSYALEAISQKELKKGKIQYEGSLDKLFKENVEKFIEYNINDVRLIVELDLKKKFVDLAVMVCHMGHVPYQYVYESSRVVEGAIMTYLKRKDIVSPNKPTTNNPELRIQVTDDSSDDDEDDKFAGAYVKEPIPGLYGWNFDLDIESEYPSAGILLNVGIETFMFKIAVEDQWDDSWNLKEMKLKDQDQSIYVENLDGDIRPTTIGQIVRMIEKNNFTVSPNGVVFSTDHISILSEVMDSWFIKRKEFKQTMIKYGKAGDHKKEDFYNLYQQVMKVFLNSIYGCLGLVSFRYSDGKDFLASAITAVGRVIITRSADYANLKYHNDYDKDSEEIKDYCLMSDTDSMYLDATQILNYLNISVDDEAAAIAAMRTVSKDFSDALNSFYENEFTKTYFNSSNNRVKIKSETIARSLYISAKKQYAQYIVDKEGVTKAEFDYKGLDFTKSSYPPLFREFVKSLIEDILFGKKKKHIDSRIIDFREKFKSFTIDEVAKPTGIKKYKEYVGLKPRAGKIFTTVRPKCPINTKAAIYHNDILNFKKLNKTYPVIQPGDKIRWCYLKNNPYHIPVIAINNNEPCPEIRDLMIKYVDRETMFDKTLVKKLDKIYENLSWGPVNTNPIANKFFK